MIAPELFLGMILRDYTSMMICVSLSISFPIFFETNDDRSGGSCVCEKGGDLNLYPG